MSSGWGQVERVANALLFEGYLLYPYRRSALKNQSRWQFGVLSPRALARDSGSEPWYSETECLFAPSTRTSLDVKVRFLHLETRVVERSVGPEQWTPVDSLSVDDVALTTWTEARPAEVSLDDIEVSEAESSRAFTREIPASRSEELVRNAAGQVVARIVRTRQPLCCAVHVTSTDCGSFRKLAVRVENVTRRSPDDDPDRDAVLTQSLVGTHTILRLQAGEFVSLLEPPSEAADLVAACRNCNTWPVLAGEPGTRNLMLSSPIILYDYPAIARESAGELCDGTEIDEMLSLRVMTLTDQERREARATDPLARAIVERTDAMPREVFARLHGATRQHGDSAHFPSGTESWEEWLNPPGAAEQSVEIGGRHVTAGARVRLRPSRRADAMDMLVAGHEARVAGVFRDLEDRPHVAVTIEAAASDDVHAAVGRYYYFHPDELEVLDEAGPDASVKRPRILVAAIGNIFLGDDGFGPAVVQRLASRALPPGTRITDYGISGVHLAYDMLDGQNDATIIVDAVGRGGPPGTLYVIDPEVDAAAPAPMDAHSVSVETVLSSLVHLGGRPTGVLIVGCEPESLDPGIGLSERVAAMVDAAADRVMQLVMQLVREERD